MGRLISAPMTIAFARFLFAAGLALSAGMVRAEPTTTNTPKPSAIAPTSPPTSSASSTVACRLNKHKDTCVITPAPKDGLRIQFKGGDQAFFVFTPAGPPTTLNRKMKDAQGRVWLMNGHHSFTLREVGGFRNEIEVTSP